MKTLKIKNRIDLIICLCLLIVPVHIDANNAIFRIKGKVDTSYNDSLVTLFTFLGNEIRSVDSTYVKDGHFSFEGSEYIYEESLVSVGSYPGAVLSADVYLKGDIDVLLEENSRVSSLFYDEYKSFRDSCNVIYRSMFGVTDKEEYGKLWDKFWQFRFEFKKKHIDDGLGRALFMDDAMTYSGIELDRYAGDLYSLFSETDKNRFDTKQAYISWTRLKDRAALVGSTFTDFTLVDKDGGSHKISDYVGKYDLLFIDLWASWCGPCIALEPTLKKVYEKYKDRGLGIITLSLDVDRKAWLKHLDKGKKEWAIDLCISSPDDDKKLKEAYKVVGIPLGILLDKYGKILFVEHSAAIEYYLDNLYGKN